MDKKPQPSRLNSEVQGGPKNEKSKAPPPPKPLGDCLTGCNPRKDPCCVGPVKPEDPKYAISPRKNPECTDVNSPVETFEDATRKRAMMKDILLKEVEEQRLHPVHDETRRDSGQMMKQYYETHPQTTRSLDFLKAHPEFQIAGPNPMRIPHDELMKAMDGFTNMQLAHEICINHDFRLERFQPPDDSMEGRVRMMMKKAYWDVFDEAMTSSTRNYKQAIGVFREMKEMLLQLLLPHNQGMRTRIEDGLNETIILEEIRLDILDFHKYSNFIINTLGQLCCPMRDKQIFALKSLEKPSELFKEILEVMEQMQLDMANFLIGQFRPTIMTNCVEYERLKFAQFIELEYRLHEDAIRVTRSWVLRHRITDRSFESVVGHAFGEVLLWKQKEWPETLTLDWVRFVAMAEETRRISFVGSVVLGCFNAAKPMFLEESANMEQINAFFIQSNKIRDLLRDNANILLTKEVTLDPRKLTEALEIVAEKAIQVTDDCLKEMKNRELTSLERDTLRGAVQDIGREEHQVRHLLIRRMQEYIAERIAAGGKSRIEFPKALMCIQGEALTICIELHRIAMHNRGVFDDLYKAIIEDEVSPPTFMNQNEGKWDPMLQKTVDILRADASRKLVMTRPAINEKLEGTKDEKGVEILGIEDGPVVETTPEIEAMIDKIIAEKKFEDDYDEYANISEKDAVARLQALNNHDSANILRQMQNEEDSNKRILEKKRKMREELRLVIKADMGLPLFHKVLYKEPKMHNYCKLLNVIAKEDAEKKANNEKPQKPGSKKSEDHKP